MNESNWLTIVFGAPVALGVAWQIVRDWRKDRVDREDEARDLAVRLALIEERQREARERDRDDDE